VEVKASLKANAGAKAAPKDTEQLLTPRGKTIKMK
jgi:hypothetical protein